MNISVRTPLIGLWLLIVLVCIALAALMIGLFQLGAGAEVQVVRRDVGAAGHEIEKHFETYAASSADTDSTWNDQKTRHDLELLLQSTLSGFKGVEGGFWNTESGFIAYAYPSYEGGVPKKDVPEAEIGRIKQVASEALSNAAPRDQHFDSERESLIIHAAPLSFRGHQFAVWTMSRAHVSAGLAYQRLATGFAVLFVFVLVSGLWIGTLLYRWLRKVTALEKAISGTHVETFYPLAETGQRELDRIVLAMNQLGIKLKASRSEAQELSAQLAKTERMNLLGRMAAEVAHDIRNPIAAMRLRAENALAKSPEHQEAALEYSLQEIQRLDDLLERLLAITRLDRLNYTEVNLQEWLNQLLVPLQERAELAGVQLTSKASSVVWMLDERAMGRALDNLIINALQHTPSGGWVSVTVTSDATFCHITVQDSGSGIPAENSSNVFEPLVTGRLQGIGLGLGIAQEIVKAHEGTLRCVKSVIGACFEIKIPCQPS